MSVVVQAPTISLGSVSYAHEWTSDLDGSHHVALHGTGTTSALVVSDVDDALGLADALQDAARRLRLRELATQRRQAVSV